MSQILDLDLAHLLRLPTIADTWQLAIVRLPKWVKESDGPAYRPRIALCLSETFGLLGASKPFERGEEDDRAALEAIRSLALIRDVRARPERIAVRDARLVEALRSMLVDQRIGIDLAESLPLVDDAYRHMVDSMAGPAGRASILDGVEVERARSFADAAASFYRAAPWNHLMDEDLVRVDSPVPDPGFKWFTVLGCAGVTFGIGFYRSEREYERMFAGEIDTAAMLTGPHWFLSFDPVFTMSIVDADLWEEQGFPLAAENAYPTLTQSLRSAPGKAPDAARLTFAEGLLRALAATTEDELDQGRWSRTVATHDGERTIDLSIPAILKPRTKAQETAPDRRLSERVLVDVKRLLSEREFENPEEANEYLQSLLGKPVPHAPAEGPAERAQELLYEALEAEGRMRIKLAREALRVFPECAEAWVLLAEEMPDLARRIELYRCGTEAAERVLGPGPFEDRIGHFWGVLETRPYMRARAGLAEGLWEAGEHQQAFEHWTDLLRLNPGDNQGIRLVLVPRLIEMGRDDEAAAVLGGYDEDISAMLRYARALVEFRREGDGDLARRWRAAGIRANPHAVKYLIGNEALPGRRPGSYALGSEDEAVLVGFALAASWKGTAGAVEWMRAARREAKRLREQKRKPRR
ncbi:MAG TPA: hypothetical protein VJY35_00865 [Candidatus Eisenbacteria bacterium]|nr:hypothetical protein [Candidatus Eisenbacteria bacterium]